VEFSVSLPVRRVSKSEVVVLFLPVSVSTHLTAPARLDGKSNIVLT
jgi:hypothetical protein